MKNKYDWALLQREYDSGLSYRDLYSKYGIVCKSFKGAIKRGDFTPRSKSDAAKLSAKAHPTTHTAEFKDRMRQLIISRYEAGWMPKAGRCKKYTHISPIAGTVSLDGTWELGVAVWLDQQGYTWRRNTRRFPYTHLKGHLSHYTPDFWVDELGGYLEVKGYETALDQCKWSQFKEPLIVWKKAELLARAILST